MPYLFKMLISIEGVTVLVGDITVTAPSAEDMCILHDLIISQTAQNHIYKDNKNITGKSTRPFFSELLKLTW